MASCLSNPQSLIPNPFYPEGISMDAWNLAILAAAGYVAVTALVRLMIGRRNQMLEQFRREVDKEKRRRQSERPAPEKPDKKRAA